MAVSPIGNMTFINQNAQVGSVQQANTQVKMDFQSMVNLQTMQEQQDEVQEVRPTEETLEVNDEREGNGKEEKGEEEENEKEDSKQEIAQDSNGQDTQDGDAPPHLNISV